LGLTVFAPVAETDSITRFRRLVELFATRG
jgi:hypothetical protein